MSFLVIGVVIAAISFFYPPAGWVIGAASLLPLFVTFVVAVITVLYHPAAVDSAVNTIAIGTANYIKDEMLYYPGAALFGASVGLFSRLLSTSS